MNKGYRLKSDFGGPNNPPRSGSGISDRCSCKEKDKLITELKMQLKALKVAWPHEWNPDPLDRCMIDENGCHCNRDKQIERILINLGP